MRLSGFGLLLVMHFSAVLASTSCATARDGHATVVVTSKPIHSLVAGVMRGVDTPLLLVDGKASPHSYAMKPSDAAKVNRARLFFRMSESLEPFTAKLVRALPDSVRVVTLAQAQGLRLLRRRTAGTFEAHEHHGHHDGHAPVRTQPRGVKAMAPHHDAGDVDPHVWLDTGNAKLLVAAIANALSEADPPHAARFAANAAALSRRLDALTDLLHQRLALVRQRPFLVFHDATQYFERQFGLEAAGSVTLTPDELPSARRITALRRKVRALGAMCAFTEPGLQQRVVAGIIEQTRARTARLDPEGVLLDSGPELYFELMQGLGGTMASCLAARKQD